MRRGFLFRKDELNALMAKKAAAENIGFTPPITHANSSSGDPVHAAAIPSRSHHVHTNSDSTLTATTTQLKSRSAATMSTTAATSTTAASMSTTAATKSTTAASHAASHLGSRSAAAPSPSPTAASPTRPSDAQSASVDVSPAEYASVRPDGTLQAGDGCSFQAATVRLPPLPAHAFPKVSNNFDSPERPSSSAAARNGSTTSPNPLLHASGSSGSPSAPAANNVSIQPHAMGGIQQQPPPQPADNTASQRRPTFAETAARKASKPSDLFAHNLNSIKPTKMNDGLTVIMPLPMYEQRLATFQFALIGRLFLPQGATPRTPDDLKGELSRLFGSSGEWLLIPLGKGFFSLKFQLHEDQIKASRLASWKLAIGSMQIRDWKPNFDPYKELSSTAQVWVRLFHLPAEYWHPEFLVGIFRAVGNVIKLDGNTAHGLVGHFARALVEIDLTAPLRETVRVGLPDNLFHVDFSYENVPLLCSFCHFVGHSADRCRRAKAASRGADQSAKDKPDSKHPNKVWMEKDLASNNPTGGAAGEDSAATGDKAAADVGDVGQSGTASALHAVGVGIGADLVGAASAAGGATGAVGMASPAAISSENRFAALRDFEDEGEVAPETHPSSSSDLLQMVTVPSSIQRTGSKNVSHNSEEKRKLVEKAKEISPLRLLRAENFLRKPRRSDRIAKKKAALPAPSRHVVPPNATPSSEIDNTVTISAEEVGIPRQSSYDPNAPHPVISRLHDKLQQATDLGANPTAYVLDPGDTRCANAMNAMNAMNIVASQRWADLMEGDHTDEGEDSVGLS